MFQNENENKDVPSELIVEWAPFTLSEGKDENLLLNASTVLQSDFLSKQEGFIRRELLKGPDNRWVDLVYWKNKEAAEKAMENASVSSACSQYFNLMTEADHNNPGEGVSLFTAKRIYN
ncbi:antibiotic biosynthesis monooxygenase family protein [Leptospira alstonii]|uniref:Antibiotic biosynthesis monooxygenase n=2 Tax=Leptospira alstonii TaxID=28452 RepID=M6D8R8_9LEPT|nr:hypothetical protein [Leptospira alstonii]EMJ97658.1 hypothetical protein LEP1GSC194_2999 [Leptospira alstonii serovar Sichuan str. 79601]EQA79437.1 hypothetical protein LEP1GSC193_3219 [Leptospira alstonii serovar Pingchang str. 80-412]